MSIDRLELGSNIRNYIELNNSLELVGVGRLIKRNKSTYLSKESNYIFPSTSGLELESGQSIPDLNFIKFLAKKRDISTEKAQLLYKKCCAELSFDLETKGKASLYGVGRLIKKSKTASFELNDSALSSTTFGLPALALNRITPLTVSPPIKKKNNYKRSFVKKDKSDIKFLSNTAAVAALFMLLVFSYHYYWPTQPVNQLSHLNIDQERLNKDPEKLLVSEKFMPELIPGMVKPKEPITICALIIGSFTRKSNALEIQDKVIAAGYQLFTEEFNGFYRVGVSMPCDEIQGGAFRKIEEAFGIDPWLRIYH